jgi:predicted metal-binding membrane protein
MGLEHGLYCLGCCWLLFVILFPLGIMNVAAMALITLLIFAEKSLPWNPRITQISGLVLLGYGLLGIFFRGLLPSMVAMS